MKSLKELEQIAIEALVTLTTAFPVPGETDYRFEAARLLLSHVDSRAGHAPHAMTATGLGILRNGDSYRFDWLEEDTSRLEDVRGYLNNELTEGQGIRDAIDILRTREATP